METEPMKNRRRATRRAAKYPRDACLLCFEPRPELLRRAPLAKLREAAAGTASPGSTRAQIKALLVQEHHLLGPDLAPDLTIPLCSNCHVLLHALLRDRGADFRTDTMRTLLHIIEFVLRVLATMHQEFARVLAVLADRVAALIRAFDTSFPAWRTLPEAQA